MIAPPPAHLIAPMACWVQSVTLKRFTAGSLVASGPTDVAAPTLFTTPVRAPNEEPRSKSSATDPGSVASTTAVRARRPLRYT